jgi:hypothetical protein
MTGDPRPEAAGSALSALTDPGRDSTNERSPIGIRRRLAAVFAGSSVVLLVGLDVSVPPVRSWFDHHAFTASVAANLLVLAVAALIVEEVVARRQRRDHALSVAVQSLIVYRQARRAYDAFGAGEADGVDVPDVTDELRTLAGMLLAASPNLYNDRGSRAFLDQAERSLVIMSRVVGASDGGLDARGRRRIDREMSQLLTKVEPLRARFPVEEQVEPDHGSGA